MVRGCVGRAVPARRYHVTLAFLGDLPAEQADRIPTMTSVASPGFDLVFDRFGSFGRGPRVLWIGPGECPKELATLVGQLRVELDDAGVGYDRRDFKPHVTLARKVTKLPELQPPQPVFWPVREFVLVESRSTADGPAYEVRRRYPIG